MLKDFLVEVYLPSNKEVIITLEHSENRYIYLVMMLEQNPYIHTKIFMMDDQRVNVGSIDFTSTCLHQNVTSELLSANLILYIK